MNGLSKYSQLVLSIYIIFTSQSFAQQETTLELKDNLETSNEIRLDPEVILGRELFKDARLSRDNSVSCASCHDISMGGDDGLQSSIGIDRKRGLINTPTVLNSGHSLAQFWDGRSRTLEEQVSGPIHNPLEMDSNWEQVVSKLKKDRLLQKKFRAIYKDGVSEKNIAQAIAKYERQLTTYNAPFDRFLAGDENALNEIEKRGYALFSQLGCGSCHQGLNLGGNLFQYFGIMGNYFSDRGNITEVDFGRFNVTKREKDRYKFKVPSLRNIADTAPYFHDGSIDDLKEAVVIMAYYQLGRSLTEQQLEELVAFLKTLSGTVRSDLL